MTERKLIPFTKWMKIRIKQNPHKNNPLQRFADENETLKYIASHGRNIAVKIGKTVYGYADSGRPITACFVTNGCDICKFMAAELSESGDCIRLYMPYTSMITDEDLSEFRQFTGCMG